MKPWIEAAKSPRVVYVLDGERLVLRFGQDPAPAEEGRSMRRALRRRHRHGQSFAEALEEWLFGL